MPTELAVLMVGVAARQAASATASTQTRLTAAAGEADLLAPEHGAFHRPTALALLRAGTAFLPRIETGSFASSDWKQE
ncbi:hypothetical protein [Stakelama tenebrarum]|uniref:hypothetical protein n=1 Tax=Stakelama tenebrarum TaxID=2711215 RepID=UPI001D188250|nr:hypothetical protein [Sphingosinithalassobacter tenebrarum]